MTYCHMLSTAAVKRGSTTITADIGDTGGNTYGRFISWRESTSAIISNYGNLATMPTVYNVVNNLSDEDSQYWSKSNLDAPKLLWEEK